MLRRLFHSPGIIAFYSPEPLKPDRREAGYTKLRGWRYALKTQKPVPSTYNLRIPIEDCILFPVSGAQLKFFRAMTPPEEAVGMVGTEVGALFRLIAKLYGFVGFRVVPEVFSGRIRPENALQMHRAHLDALFRRLAQ
jgi:hypothetical protein